MSVHVYTCCIVIYRLSTHARPLEFTKKITLKSLLVLKTIKILNLRLLSSDSDSDSSEKEVLTLQTSI